MSATGIGAVYTRQSRNALQIDTETLPEVTRATGWIVEGADLSVTQVHQIQRHMAETVGVFLGMYHSLKRGTRN